MHKIATFAQMVSKYLIQENQVFIYSVTNLILVQKSWSLLGHPSFDTGVLLWEEDDNMKFCIGGLCIMWDF